MALVVVKLYLSDVWQLGYLFKIVAFVGLGVLLLTVSYLYSRFRPRSRNCGKMMRAPSISSHCEVARSLCAAFLLLFAVLANAATLDLSAWQYRKRIPLTPGDGLAVAKLDRDVYFGAASDLSDLRVLRDGVEVPFGLRTLLRTGEDDMRLPERILDMSVIDSSRIQFTVHVPLTRKDRIRLDVRQQNFDKGSALRPATTICIGP